MHIFDVFLVLTKFTHQVHQYGLSLLFSHQEHACQSPEHIVQHCLSMDDTPLGVHDNPSAFHAVPLQG